METGRYYRATKLYHPTEILDTYCINRRPCYRSLRKIQNIKSSNVHHIILSVKPPHIYQRLDDVHKTFEVSVVPESFKDLAIVFVSYSLQLLEDQLANLQISNIHKVYIH